MSIYIVSHIKIKDQPMVGYKKIYVGPNSNSLAEDLTHDITDSITKDNIAHKNSNYCELTALYQISRISNKDEDPIGLVHYRRRFLSKKLKHLTPLVKKLSAINCTRPLKIIENKAELKINEARKILESYDIIVPQKIKIKNSIDEQYRIHHIGSHLDLLRSVIINKSPSYLTAFDDYFSQNKSYLFNMFIARKEFVKEYSEWLFEILCATEKHIDVSSIDKYQQRVFGFMAERLLNVYLTKNKNIKTYECPVSYLYPNQRIIKYMPNFLK